MGRTKTDPNDPLVDVVADRLGVLLHLSGRGHGEVLAAADQVLGRRLGASLLSDLLHGRQKRARRSVVLALAEGIAGDDPATVADYQSYLLGASASPKLANAPGPIFNRLKERGIEPGLLYFAILDMLTLPHAATRLLLGTAARNDGSWIALVGATFKAIEEAVATFTPSKPSPFDAAWYRETAERLGVPAERIESMLAKADKSGMLAEIERDNAPPAAAGKGKGKGRKAG